MNKEKKQEKNINEMMDLIKGKKIKQGKKETAVKKTGKNYNEFLPEKTQDFLEKNTEQKTQKDEFKEKQEKETGQQPFLKKKVEQKTQNFLEKNTEQKTQKDEFKEKQEKEIEKMIGFLKTDENTDLKKDKLTEKVNKLVEETEKELGKIQFTGKKQEEKKKQFLIDRIKNALKK